MFVRRFSVLMVLAVLLGLAPAWAQEKEAPPDVRADVAAILDGYSDRLAELIQGDGGRSAEDALREETKASLLELVAKHRPGGDAAPRDLTAAYDALCGVFAPPGEALLTLVEELFGQDPDADAWSVLVEVRQRRVMGEYKDPTAAARKLRSWVSAFRKGVPTSSATGRALDLMTARLDLDTGDLTGALSIAKRIAESGDGSPVLHQAAIEITARAGALPPGFAAPDFKLLLRGAGPAFELASLRGRMVLLLFVGDDEDARGRLKFAETVGDMAPSHELAVVVVPNGGELLDPKEAPVDIAWYDLHAGDAARSVAAQYRVGEDASGMFLIGPDGRILESARWDLPDAKSRVTDHLRRKLGASIQDVLLGVSAKRFRGWPAFRATWRSLVSRRDALAAPTSMAEAQALGKRAVWALMLAAETAGVPTRYPFEAPPTDLRGRIVVAWCSRDTLAGSDQWLTLIEPVTKAKGDACLEVVDALHDLGIADDEARPLLEAVAAKTRDWRVASMALRTLGSGEHDVRPERLAKLAKHKTWQVRLALAEAYAAYRHPDSVDALIALLGADRLRVRATASAGLKSLTQVDHGLNQKAWAAWRNEQGAGLVLPPRNRDVARTGLDAHDYGAKGYFGLKIVSDRIVFVLDKSESMYYGLFDTVVDEVELFLTAAGPTTSFALVEFDADPRVWKKKLVPANGRSVAGATGFLNRAKPYGPTNVMDSLDLAFDVKNVDTVVMLSDGLPNRGAETVPRKIVQAVDVENRYTRLAIHTVWMTRGRVFDHDGPKGEDKPPLTDTEKSRRARVRERAPKQALARFLEELAARNEGTFGIAFGDMYRPPPGAGTRPSTDK